MCQVLTSKNIRPMYSFIWKLKQNLHHDPLFFTHFTVNTIIQNRELLLFTGRGLSIYGGPEALGVQEGDQIFF